MIGNEIIRFVNERSEYSSDFRIVVFVDGKRKIKKARLLYTTSRTAAGWMVSCSYILDLLTTYDFQPSPFSIDTKGCKDPKPSRLCQYY